MTGWLAAMVAAAACALTGATIAAHGAQQVTQPQARPAQTSTPTPAQSQTTTQPAQTQTAPTQSPTPQAAGTGYLGNIFGGGTANGCNYASGYQAGDCNPTGETEQEYIEDPGGPDPGTKTNSQGCYYVKMNSGYCPSTGQYIPMQDPNDPNN
jgi:hypothetical protein